MLSVLLHLVANRIKKGVEVLFTLILHPLICVHLRILEPRVSANFLVSCGTPASLPTGLPTLANQMKNMPTDAAR